MNRKAGVVIGVIVIAGAAWTGAAWYTGKQAEQVVRQQIAEGNATLQTYVPNATLSLASLDRHLFSTDVRYRLQITQPATSEAAPREMDFIVVDHLSHGPLPLTEIKHGRLLPAMAASNFALEPTDSAKPWFEAANGAVPLSGHARIGYGNGVTGVFTLAPVKVQQPETQLDFSGLNADFAVDGKSRATRVQAAVESLALKLENADDGADLAVSGLSLTSDMKPGASGLYLGTNTLNIKNTQVVLRDTPALQLADYSQHADVREDARGLAMRGQYDIGMVSYGGKELMGVQFALGGLHLAPQAVKTLGRINSDTVVQVMRAPAQSAAVPGGDAALQAQREEIVTAVQQILQGNPSFFIGPLQLKNAKGVSSFDLTLDLTDPGDTEASLDDLVARTVRTFDAKLTLSTPMMATTVSQILQADGVDAAAADAHGQMVAQAIAAQAQATGFMTAAGDDVVAALQYRDKVITLNGAQIPAQQFAAMVIGTAMSLAGAYGEGVAGDEPERAAPPAQGSSGTQAAPPAGAQVAPKAAPRR